MEDEAKRKRERQRSGGAKISAPTHLNSTKVESTQLLSQPKKKKKKSFSKFQVSFKNQIFNSKILIPKLSIAHSQCPNFKLKYLVFKNSNFKFQDQNPKP